MPEPDLVVIRTFLNGYEAQVARSALESVGIDAIVRSDDAGGVHPGMWTARGVQLIVRAEDAAQAEAALTSFAGPMDVESADEP